MSIPHNGLRDPEKETKDDYDARVGSIDQGFRDEHTAYGVAVDEKGHTVLEGTFDPVYEAKARVLNRAIQDIGMGAYQWQLFVVIGFGWASDNMMPIVTSLILPVIAKEFNPVHKEFLPLAQNLGLLAGAVFWGLGADVIGRKIGFNLTLGITAVFAMIAASSPNFAAIAVFDALWSFGVGGNLPIDSAIFLEFLPASHQYLLTVLSVDWALAQVVATLIAWPLLGTLTCSDAETCTRSQNMGWRWYVITMGGILLIMFIIRFIFFHIYESPKFLMGKGKDEEAVRVVHEVARRNGKTVNLTVDDLKACEPEGYVGRTDATEALRRSLLKRVNMSHVRSLFSTPRIAFSTSMIMLIWLIIGLAYPLYNGFLPLLVSNSGSSTYITYRNMLIIAVLGVPGAIIGAILSEWRFMGRKGVLAMSTALTGVFLLCNTTARTNPNAQLGWNCAYNFFSTICYAILYAYTPEVFPTFSRGTGNALTASCNRVMGVMAPVIGIYAKAGTWVPVYAAGAMFIAAGLLALILPFESRGKASL